MRSFSKGTRTRLSSIGGSISAESIVIISKTDNHPIIIAVRMERVLQRLEGIERFLLKDPTLRTLAASQATAPFIGLRAEEVIKAVVNGRREQEIDMLQERLHAYERADCTDSMALKQMLADSTSEIARLERALLAKQDQLDIITKSHR